MNELINTLEQKRKEFKLPYKDLAGKAGMMPDTVRAILQNKQCPKLLTLIAITDILGMRIIVVDKL